MKERTSVKTFLLPPFSRASAAHGSATGCTAQNASHPTEQSAVDQSQSLSSGPGYMMQHLTTVDSLIWAKIGGLWPVKFKINLMNGVEYSSSI